MQRVRGCVICSNNLAGLEGCQNYPDNIVVSGRDKAEHDQRLDAFFQRIGDLGLTVNSKRCSFGGSIL